MTLYVRTMGWLDAVPKPAKTAKKSKAAQDDSPSVTRREKLLADGADLPALDPGPAAYLLDYFFELGPMHFSPMGEVPIGFEQIDAWQRVTGLELSPWEAFTLRKLSLAYGNEKSAGVSPVAAAPGGVFESSEDTVERRERVSRGLGAQLRSFRRKSDA